MSFAPTTEQQHILGLFETGQDVVIQAGAGTGKTTTLIQLAASTRRRGQYIAFNKAIVTEAGTKMPGTVTCSTAHSLAYRAVGATYAHRLRNSQRMKSIDLANRLKVDAMQVVAFDGSKKMLSRTFLAGLAMRGITRFCQSADPDPTMRHVPYVEGLDAPADDDGGHRRNVVNKQVAKHLEPALRLAWKDLMDIEGNLPYRHDHYLKAWQLDDPRIGADYILFDECQDANPVLLAIVEAQKHAQRVFVGDSQQAIYGFTGAVDALSRIEATGAAVGYLTQSFRFGPAVADVANTMLGHLEAELRLTGYDEIASVVGPVAEPDVILTRTNAVAVRTLLQKQSDGLRVHLVGGGADIVSFAKAARQLMEGERTEHPELACFETWLEVQEYVKQDEQGGDLRLMVGLVDEFGVPTILEALDRNIREDDADIVISTAHKSKGREWNSVQLAGDFPPEPKKEELRLLYVACTRAKRELDIEGVPFVRDGYTPSQHPVVATTASQAALAQPVQPVVMPQQEGPVAAPKSTNEHYGNIGDRADLELTVLRVAATPTRYGGYPTTLADAEGRRFKWFADEQLEKGMEVSGSWQVKAHDEYNGTLETIINYPRGVQVTA